MAINGNVILVYSGDTVIAGTKSHEMQTNVEKLGVSSPDTGEWRTYKPGHKEWSLNVGYLVLSASALGVANSNGLKDLLCAGNYYTLKIKNRGAQDSEGLIGTALLLTCRITAARGNLVQGAFTFVGSGPLSVPSAE